MLSSALLLPGLGVIQTSPAAWLASIRWLCVALAERWSRSVAWNSTGMGTEQQQANDCKRRSVYMHE